jgi:3-phosphoshikimate 1-carboxyvinyltransferase
MAAAAKCGAIFTHTDRLRLKESDRISAMVQELEKFGARFEIIDGIDGGRVTVLSPEGGLRTPTSVLHGHNDHRVVMSLAVLSACMSDPTPICIDDAHAVTKSFPDFFDRLQGLGIDCRLT